jgi:hypothetical protein
VPPVYARARVCEVVVDQHVVEQWRVPLPLVPLERGLPELSEVPARRQAHVRPEARCCRKRADQGQMGRARGVRGKLGVRGAKRAQSERAAPCTRAPELAVSPSTAMEPPTPRPMF